jgi:hypothetical protein
MSEPFSDKSRVKHIVKHLPSRWNNTTELVAGKILAKQFSEIRADEAEQCAKAADDVADWHETHMAESGYDDFRRERLDTAREISATIRARYAESAAQAKRNDRDNNGAL